jgi:hypothetical protein
MHYLTNFIIILIFISYGYKHLRLHTLLILKIYYSTFLFLFKFFHTFLVFWLFQISRQIYFLSFFLWLLFDLFITCNTIPNNWFWLLYRGIVVKGLLLGEFLSWFLDEGRSHVFLQVLDVIDRNLTLKFLKLNVLNLLSLLTFTFFLNCLLGLIYQSFWEGLVSFLLLLLNLLHGLFMVFNLPWISSTCLFRLRLLLLYREIELLLDYKFFLVDTLFEFFIEIRCTMRILLNI